MRNNRDSIPWCASIACADLAVIEKLTDRNALLEFATHDKDREVRKARVSKLSGNADLPKIISREQDREVKTVAITRLEFSKTLSQSILWMRVDALHEIQPVREYLSSYPNGAHAAPARAFLEGPDVLDGRLAVSL